MVLPYSVPLSCFLPPLWKIQQAMGQEASGRILFDGDERTYE